MTEQIQLIPDTIIFIDYIHKRLLAPEFLTESSTGIRTIEDYEAALMNIYSLLADQNIVFDSQVNLVQAEYALAIIDTMIANTTDIAALLPILFSIINVSVQPNSDSPFSPMDNILRKARDKELRDLRLKLLDSIRSCSDDHFPEYIPLQQYVDEIQKAIEIICVNTGETPELRDNVWREIFSSEEDKAGPNAAPSAVQISSKGKLSVIFPDFDIVRSFNNNPLGANIRKTIAHELVHCILSVKAVQSLGEFINELIPITLVGGGHMDVWSMRDYLSFLSDGKLEQIIKQIWKEKLDPSLILQAISKFLGFKGLLALSLVNPIGYAETRLEKQGEITLDGLSLTGNDRYKNMMNILLSESLIRNPELLDGLEQNSDRLRLIRQIQARTVMARHFQLPVQLSMLLDMNN